LIKAAVYKYFLEAQGNYGLIRREKCILSRLALVTGVLST